MCILLRNQLIIISLYVQLQTLLEPGMVCNLSNGCSVRRVDHQHPAKKVLQFLGGLVILWDEVVPIDNPLCLLASAKAACCRLSENPSELSIATSGLLTRLGWRLGPVEKCLNELTAQDCCTVGTAGVCLDRIRVCI